MFLYYYLLVSLSVPIVVQVISVVNTCSSCTGTCSNITEITLPTIITTIEIGAFSDCENLLSVIIPSTCTAIGDEAFYNNANLVNVVIPTSVVRIGFAAFSQCRSLQSLLIPTSVVYLPGSLCSGCSSLPSINIPSSVTYIDKMAFGMCKSLKQVVASGNLQLAPSVFFGSSRSQLLPLLSPTTTPTSVSKSSSSALLSTYIIIGVIVGVVVILLIAAIAVYFWMQRDCLIAPGRGDGKAAPLCVKDADKDRAETIRNIIVDALDLLQSEESPQIQSARELELRRAVNDLKEKSRQPKDPFIMVLADVCKEYSFSELARFNFLEVLLSVDIFSRKDIGTQDLHLLKAIFLLIIHEENWELLQTNAAKIVSCLSSQEVCTAVSDRRRNTSKSISTEELIIIINVDVGSVASSQYPVSNSGSSEERKRYEFLEARNMQVFFAGAIAKMCLIFSCANRNCSKLFDDQKDLCNKLFKTVQDIHASQRKLTLLEEPSGISSGQLVDYKLAIGSIMDVIPLLCASSLSDIAALPMCRPDLIQGVDMVAEWLSASEALIKQVVVITKDQLNPGMYSNIIEHQFTLAHNLLFNSTAALSHLYSEPMDSQIFNLPLLDKVRCLLTTCSQLTDPENKSSAGFLSRLSADTAAVRESSVSHMCNTLYLFCKSLRGDRVLQPSSPAGEHDILAKSESIPVSTPTHHVLTRHASYRSVEAVTVERQKSASDLSVQAFVNELCTCGMIQSMLVFTAANSGKSLAVVRLIAAFTELKDSHKVFSNLELPLLQLIDSICCLHETMFELPNNLLSASPSHHGQLSNDVLRDNLLGFPEGGDNIASNSPNRLSKGYYDFLESKTVEGCDIDFEVSGSTDSLVVCACYTLANLCRVNDNLSLRTLESNLFQTLVAIVQATRSGRVCRQSVRCIDTICSSLVRKKSEHFPEEDSQQLSAALDALTTSLGCPSILLQKCAMSAIASISQLSPFLRNKVAEGALKYMTQLIAASSNSDKLEIESAVDDVLSKLGFAGGLKDLYTCDKDYDSLRIWYRIKQSINHQRAGLRLIKKWAYDCFQSGSGPAPLMPVEGFCSDELAVKTISAFLGHEEESASRDHLQGKTNIFDFMKFEEDLDGQPGFGSSVQRDYDEHYPRSVEYIWSLFTPSHLQRIVNMGLLSLGGPIEVNSSGNQQLISKIQNMKGIYLSREQSWSLRFIDRVLKYAVEESVRVNPGEYWSLAFDDCLYDKDFHLALISVTTACPFLTSISFRSSSSDSKSSLLGSELGKLSSSVAFLSFDGSLSDHQVQLLCTTLRTRSDRPAAGKGLRGLAITNMELDRSVALIDILSLLRGQSNSPTLPKQATSLLKLQYLDLSYNGLSDENCSAILLASLQGGIEGVELAGNMLCEAAEFISVWKSYYQSSDGQPKDKLVYLGLSRNHLSRLAVKTLLETLTEKSSSLTYLDLSGNNIDELDNDVFRDALVGNNILRVLDLSHNRLSETAMHQLHLGMLENRSLLLLPISGNALSEQAFISLSHIRYALKSNRETFSGKVSPVSTSLLRVAPDVSVDTLHVFFSTPLARFVNAQQAAPLEVLNYSTERDLFLQIFEKESRNVGLHFNFATTNSLGDSLRHQCRALHFSGHGETGGLCFEDGQAGLQILPARALGRILAAGGAAGNANLQFVFVSACHSREIGETFIKAGIRHVVCVRIESKIQDAAAIEFTRAFYKSFLRGRSIVDSFALASEELRNAPHIHGSMLEGDKFVLLPEEKDIIAMPHNLLEPTVRSISTGSGAGLGSGSMPTSRERYYEYHSTVIFTGQQLTNWPSESSHCTMGKHFTNLEAFLARTRLPSLPEEFEGRQVSMHELIKNIHQKRLVSLVGPHGVGKSVLTVAVCRYLTDREVFADSVYLYRANGRRDCKAFVEGLKDALLQSGNNPVSTQLLALSSTSDLEQSPCASGSSSIAADEENILKSIERREMLLVIDQMEEFLDSDAENANYLKKFLSKLFDRSQKVKVLMVSKEALVKRNIQQVGNSIVEVPVYLQPLSLESTVRLFSVLSPSLSTMIEKERFIDAVLSGNLTQRHLTIASRDLNEKSMQIFKLFNDGVPGEIIAMASHSSPDSIAALKASVREILQVQ